MSLETLMEFSTTSEFPGLIPILTARSMEYTVCKEFVNNGYYGISMYEEENDNLPIKTSPYYILLL